MVSTGLLNIIVLADGGGAFRTMAGGRRLHTAAQQSRSRRYRPLTQPFLIFSPASPASPTLNRPSPYRQPPSLKPWPSAAKPSPKSRGSRWLCYLWIACCSVFTVGRKGAKAFEAPAVPSTGG